MQIILFWLKRARKVNTLTKLNREGEPFLSCTPNLISRFQSQSRKCRAGNVRIMDIEIKSKLALQSLNKVGPGHKAPPFPQGCYLIHIMEIIK